MRGEKNSALMNHAAQGGVGPICFCDFVRGSYLPFVRENKRSWKTDERYLNQHVLPYLGECPLSAVSREMILSWLETLENAGLSSSSRYRMFWLLKYVLNCAVRWGVLKSDIEFRGLAYPRKTQQRHPELLSPEEMFTLIRLLDEYADRPSAQAIHLLLLTGASKSEILYARWEDVHLDQAVLEARQTFTGVPRLISLNAAAVRLILSIPRRHGVPWMFATSSGSRLASISYTWNLLRQKLGRPQMRIQDIRHSYACCLVSTGCQQKHVKNVMGHYLPERFIQIRNAILASKETA